MAGLQDIIDRAGGWNTVSAHREPGGGVVVMLAHRATLDDALLVYVPDDEHVAEPDSEVGERTNEGGPWNAVQDAHDGAEAKLREGLAEVTDSYGMAFQDAPWWPEAVALARALGAGVGTIPDDKQRERER